MKVLFITRKIALLCIDKRRYEKLFSSKIDNDFAEEIYYLQLEGLICNNDDEIIVTPKGMFFSDTVAGVFAFRKMKLMKMLNLIKDLNPNDEKYFYSGESIKPRGGGGSSAYSSGRRVNIVGSCRIRVALPVVWWLVSRPRPPPPATAPAGDCA
jgi:hypothetical protein